MLDEEKRPFRSAMYPRSWLAKIELIKCVLVDEASSQPDVDALACGYIYMQWISTGAIICVEGGGQSHWPPTLAFKLCHGLMHWPAVAPSDVSLFT